MVLVFIKVLWLLWLPVRIEPNQKLHRERDLKLIGGGCIIASSTMQLCALNELRDALAYVKCPQV